MTGRSVRLGMLGAVLGTLAFLPGCGPSTADRTPDLSGLPLLNGTKIVEQVKHCDAGANAYCALEFVAVNRGYHSSMELLESEQHLLHRRGWTYAVGDIQGERAADSPGHKLRVTYATAQTDLTGIDFGWIQRARPITLTLSHELFTRSSSLSFLLQIGNA